MNVDQLMILSAPHIACYALTVEPNTALQKMISLKKKADINPDQQARQFLLLMKWMREPDMSIMKFQILQNQVSEQA